MKDIRIFLSEIFQFLVEKCSIYLNRRVFIMEFFDQYALVVNVNEYQHLLSRCLNNWGASETHFL